MAEIEFCLLYKRLTVFLDGQVVLVHTDMGRLPTASDVVKALGLFRVKEGPVFKAWEQQLNAEQGWIG